MFSKAKVKRFNEEGSCAPAPNAYDAKAVEGNKAGVVTVSSKRFEDPKYITPGPGQYKVPSTIGVKAGSVASIPGLVRSASFRVKKSSLADLTSTSIKSDFCSTPISKTPRRKIRRSVSSTNLSSPSPSNTESVEELKALNGKLELELAQLKLKLAAEQESVLVKCEHENEDTENLNLRDKLEAVEAELEVCKSELRYRTAMCEEIQDERDKLASQCDQLAEKGDRVESLKNEVDLLTQDNDTLEQEISSLQDQRRQAEQELEEVRARRLELEKKCEAEDAKNVFLHFTQEQLNSQVVSLECVVNSVKQENHLLSRALKKMVALIQEEKTKIAEITEAYSRENADSELEFNKLEKQLKDCKLVEIELRAQLGEAMVCRQDIQDKLNMSDKKLFTAIMELDQLRATKEKLSEEVEEAARDLEVSENDKTVLKDSLASAEAEKNGLALDLGEVTKGKLEVEAKLKMAERQLEDKELALEDARGEIHEIEMSKVGLEGALASLREEFGGMELTLVEEIDEKQHAMDQMKTLKSRCEEQESLLTESRGLVSSLEEVNSLLTRKEDELRHDLETLRTKVTSVEAELIETTTTADKLKTTMQTFKQENEDELSQKEAEIEDLKAKLMETQIGRDEVEERLLDTQGLVETMEIKNKQTFQEHKEVEERLVQEVRQLSRSLTEKSQERAELMAINKDLSAQVSESLHAISNLQTREQSLGQRCREYELEVEILNEVAEGSKTKLKVAEEEIGSLQMELEAGLQEIGETEAEKIQLTHQIRVLEEDLEGLETSLTQARLELMETKTVGRELLQRVQELEAGHEKLEQETNTWKQVSHDKEQEVLLVRDQVSHLETLRDNLDLNVEEKTSLLASLRDELAAFRAQTEIEKAKHDETMKTNLRLKGNLEQHQEELRAARQQLDQQQQQQRQLQDQLQQHQLEKRQLQHEHQLQTEELGAARQELEQVRKEHHASQQECSALRTSQEDKSSRVKSLEAAMEDKEAKLKSMENEIKARSSKIQSLDTAMEEKSSHIRGLETRLEEKSSKIDGLEAERVEKERLRMKDMEMLIQLREEVEARKAEISRLSEVAEREESAQRSMEAQQRVLCEAEGRAASAEEALAAWQAKMAEAEEVMVQMEAKLETEEAENRSLRDMIEPFKDQLESFEIEKNNLLSQSNQAQDEIKKLATQYGKLLGHQNQKQKIQHVVKIKQETVELKSEIAALKEQNAKLKKANTRLEDKLRDATGARKFDPRMSFQTPGGNRNKENSSVCMTPDKSVLSSTPLMGPPQSVNKARANSRSSSIGSPLRN